jgi:hypothetical protein
MKESSKSKKLEAEGKESEESSSFGEGIHSLFEIASRPANAWVTRLFILASICVVGTFQLAFHSHMYTSIS